MSHFAKVVDGVVTAVIVADRAFIDSGGVEDPSAWIQTPYNGSLSGRYAGIGNTYDSVSGLFIDSKPYPSWVLREGKWEAPVPRPEEEVDALLSWNEDTISWEHVKI